MRVLLVDDEPLILRALERVLRRSRPGWVVESVAGGAEALRSMAAAPADLVLADLDMPGLDGVALLSAIRDHHPTTVRMVLSGTGDPAVRLRTVPLAQRFLAKPCEIDVLLEALDDAARLLAGGRSPALDAVVALDTLPSSPPIYGALSRALDRDGTSMRDLEEIVQQDPAIAARVLQIVNSAFFGLPRTVESLSQALAFLGMSALRSLVLSVEAFKVFDASRSCPGFSLESHRSHALLAARIASRVAPSRERDTAFTAGLLHDVGKLVLASRAPDAYARVQAMVRLRGRNAYEVEEEILGLSHAAVGEALLRLWGLPGTVLAIVGRHHEPGAFAEGWGAGAAVRTANRLARGAARAAGLEEGLPPDVSLEDPPLEKAARTAGGLQAMEEVAREEMGRVLVELVRVEAP